MIWLQFVNIHYQYFLPMANLFISGNDADLITRTLNNELKVIYLWLKANKLSLNITKTHVMIFQQD